MSDLSTPHPANGRLRPLFVLCLWGLAVSVPVSAAPPIAPLPQPIYSLDGNSPATSSCGVTAGDVLIPGTICPQQRLPSSALQLINLADEIDGLSRSNAYLQSTQTFVLLFSVDRLTIGTVGPDPYLQSHDVPHNVFEQADKGQAAGDQFASTQLFTQLGFFTAAGTRNGGNNGLVRNNYDEGGVDFSAQPPSHSRDDTGNPPQDNVDAAVTPEESTTSRGDLINLYFSLDANSPSLPTLSGGSQPSGANVFYNAAPRSDPNGTITTLYASSTELGLVPLDDIDALIVMDLDPNEPLGFGRFSPPDIVLFSLRPGSPSLSTIYGHSLIGAAADIYVARWGQGPELFAAADALGLGAYPDNVDALDLIPAGEGPAFIVQHGIRLIRGDWDDNGWVNFDDFLPLDLCMNGPDILPSIQECDIYDFQRDLDVDLADFRGFQLAFGDAALP